MEAITQEKKIELLRTGLQIYASDIRSTLDILTKIHSSYSAVILELEYILERTK